MIEWIKSWSNGIIVAIIIAVIFELIIPNGNNKKYIKMVISLFVLFVILDPIISKFTSLNGIEINTKEYEKYFDSTNTLETSTTLDSEKLINNTAEKRVKENISNKLKELGYKVESISININNESGQINRIVLSVRRNDNGTDDSEHLELKNSIVKIDNVNEVNISSKDNTKKSNLRKSDIQKIKRLICKDYEVAEENIELS